MALQSALRLAYDRFGHDLLFRALTRSELVLDRPTLLSTARRTVRYGSTETYRPPAPEGPSPTPARLRRKDRRLVDPEPVVCALPDVELVGTYGLPIDDHGRYVLESRTGAHALTDEIAATLGDRTLPVRRGRGPQYDRPVVDLTGIWSDEFYHWFADYLPRLRGVEAYTAATDADPVIIIPSDAPTWIHESLLLAGFSDDRIQMWTNSAARADCLIVPSNPGYVPDEESMSAATSPTAMRWVRDRLVASVGIERGGNERVLITRRSAADRRLANENEVVAVLAEKGFEPVDLTQFSLPEQIRLFANAEAVVAPHGAGLINMIYGEDMKILELFGDYDNACFYCLAGGFDFTYRYEVCDDLDGDLLVDTDALEIAVERLLDE